MKLSPNQKLILERLKKEGYVSVTTRQGNKREFNAASALVEKGLAEIESEATGTYYTGRTAQSKQKFFIDRIIRLK